MNVMIYADSDGVGMNQDDPNLKGSSANQLSLNHVGQEKHLKIVIETMMKMMQIESNTRYLMQNVILKQEKICLLCFERIIQKIESSIITKMHC